MSLTGGRLQIADQHYAPPCAGQHLLCPLLTTRLATLWSQTGWASPPESRQQLCPSVRRTLPIMPPTDNKVSLVCVVKPSGHLLQRAAHSYTPSYTGYHLLCPLPTTRLAKLWCEPEWASPPESRPPLRPPYTGHHLLCLLLTTRLTKLWSWTELWSRTEGVFPPENWPPLCPSIH